MKPSLETIRNFINDTIIADAPITFHLFKYNEPKNGNLDLKQISVAKHNTNGYNSTPSIKPISKTTRKPYV